MHTLKCSSIDYYKHAQGLSSTPATFLEPADLPLCVSGRIKRQVLDKYKVLSADTGHHSGTDCTTLECGLLFFCAPSCTQQNPRPALHQTSAQIYLNLMHRRTVHPPGSTGEKRDSGWVRLERRAHLFPKSLRETGTDRKRETKRKRDCGLGVIAVFSLHAQLL